MDACQTKHVVMMYSDTFTCTNNLLPTINAISLAVIMLNNTVTYVEGGAKTPRRLLLAFS